jgi:2-methylcitrate dehydratase PrpD
MTRQSTGIARTLASFAVQTPSEEIPAAVTDYAVRAVADTVAVAVAGRNEPATTILRATMARPHPDERSSVWPDGGAWSAADAALLNGTAGHALDYDDVAEHIHGHPSVVLVPALLAVAEPIAAKGRDILDAYAVGFEVQAALGAAMDLRRHFARGWHSTSSIAGVGGAAAVCRLLGATVDQTEVAIAIAVSMAGGSRENFGTMTKPLHAGLAARDAVLAARLAMGGYTGADTIIEGPAGYFSMFYPDEPDLDAALDAIEHPWQILKSGLSIKRYPCCYNTGRLSRAALDVHERYDVRTQDVVGIRITLEPGGLDPLIHHRPSTGLEGKFSGELVAASALVDGVLGFETFTDPAVRRDEVVRLVAATQIVESDVPPQGDPSWDEGYATVDVELADGTRHSARVDDPPGHWRNPMTGGELLQKVADCFRHGGSSCSPEDFVEEVSQLEHATFTGFSSLRTATR